MKDSEDFPIAEPSKPSRHLTFEDAVNVWLLWWQGEKKHRIASNFDVNVWRIYDVKHGKLHPGSEKVASEIWQQRFGGKPRLH